MDIESAYAFLFRRANEELKIIRNQGISSFSHDQYSDAAENARKAERIKTIITLLKKSYESWQEFKLDDHVPTLHIAEPRERGPHGLVTPQKAFRLPLLKSLVEMGGRGRTRLVLDRVGEMMASKLNDFDRAFLANGREIRWRNAVCWERNECVKEGLLKRGSPKGIWEISERGRQYMSENN